MVETILGLDLGTNSVGWAVVRRDDDTLPPTIDAGVYVFPDAGELDGGLFVSHRSVRGQKRRQRIQLRRKRQRMQGVTNALVENGLLPADPAERAQLLARDHDEAGERTHHPFTLRRRGLDEALTLHEFGRCLHHIARRRGYFSTRDLMHRHLEQAVGFARAAQADLTPDAGDEGGDEERKEQSRLLARLAEVREKIAKGEARTVGEFCAARLADPAAFPGGVRASGKRKEKRQSKQDPLGWRADRLLHEEEFEKLWDAQAPYHPAALTAALRDRIRERMFHQRPLISKRDAVGMCTFYPQRKRMPRAAMLAQRCTVLQTLVNQTLRERDGAPFRRLTGEEVATLAFELDRRDRLTWAEAKALIGMPKSAAFRDEPAPKRGSVPATRGHRFIGGNRTAQAMREALGERWIAMTQDQQDTLVDRVLYAHDPASLARSLRRGFGLTDAEVYAVACTELTDEYTGHCARVWKALEPLMIAGMHYDEACVAAGFREANTSTVPAVTDALDRLGAAPDLRNPVVQRALKMAYRVINAVIDRYGKPDRIRIEMPRDVSRTNKQRQQMWEEQDRNARENERALKLLKDAGMDAGSRGVNVKKVRLWWEAGSCSPYEPGVEVTLRQVVEEYEVDHIVPRSRSLDDSWGNLTIISRGQNLEKGNRTPYEWIGPSEKWDRVRLHMAGVRGMRRSKRDRFLREAWEEADFTNRALSDTRFLSRAVKAAVEQLGRPVDVSPGRLTADLRSLWELGDVLASTPEQEEKLQAWRDRAVKKSAKPRFDHRHHALDAILTALTDIRTLQGMTRWYKEREAGLPSSRIPKPLPWPTIGGDLRRLMETVPVVHTPTRQVMGALHEETARTPPSREAVDAALAALPPDRRGRVRRAVVVGSQLVRLADDGRPLAAYDLGSNHHVVVWERETPDPAGRRPRDITVVTMMEAARRAQAGEPLFGAERPGWRRITALCKNDIVEWTGDDAGLLRVAAFSVTETWQEVRLRGLREARADASGTIRVLGQKALRCIHRRVSLSPLGEIIASEPDDAGD